MHNVIQQVVVSHKDDDIQNTHIKEEKYMSIESPPHEQKIWDEWLETKNERSENKLIEHYKYLVSFHVERISVNIPSNVQKDDLESYAYLGLLDAIHKFEPERALKFDTYASFRVRGSIIDGLRKEDWLPRTQREKTKRVERAIQALEQQLQRTPTAEEIADKIQMTVTEVETLIKDDLFANVLSIDQKATSEEHEQREGIGYMIPDNQADQPDEQMLQSELKGDLANNIKQLNENEQVVISLFYDEELTMTEIGKVLELTTSRISQIHTRAIFKLRNQLKKLHYRI